tara:strand:- start:248 stop:442 length:195 start_codon:yes stop_codon:yes gene_type:complete
MKKILTATIEKELSDWVEREKTRKDSVGRSLYRNKSQLIEELVILGKKTLEELESEKEKTQKKE